MFAAPPHKRALARPCAAPPDSTGSRAGPAEDDTIGRAPAGRQRSGGLPAPGGPGALPADDWALLFEAVCLRLQAGADAAPPGDPLARCVAEGVQALRSLQPLRSPTRDAQRAGRPVRRSRGPGA